MALKNKVKILTLIISVQVQIKTISLISMRIFILSFLIPLLLPQLYECTVSSNESKC